MLRKIRQMLKSQEGFTLVELMIVVVILGILAGIGIQQYGNVQQRARQAAHDANVKIITSAANMYLMMESFEAPTESSGPETPFLKFPASGDDETDLVPKYLDAWPEYPLSPDQNYVVKIGVTVTKDGDLLYEVDVATEQKSETS